MCCCLKGLMTWVEPYVVIWPSSMHAHVSALICQYLTGAHAQYHGQPKVYTLIC